MRPLSREFLLQRGYCCHHGCVNCPYIRVESKMKTPSEDINTYIIVSEKIEAIAKRYTKLYMECDSFAADISYNLFSKMIYFKMQPSTPGIGIPANFPLYLLEFEDNVLEEVLAALVKEQKNKTMESIKRNTCNACGQQKITSMGPFFPLTYHW